MTSPAPPPRPFPGHFGELIQGRLGPAGPVALITLPLRQPVLMAHADRIVPCEEWGQGLGLSTAFHLARLWQAEPDASRERQIAHCLQSEGASDPMMLEDPARVLWASRQGRVLARLPEPAEFDLVGGLWGTGQRTDPQDEDFDDITDLARDWPTAAADLPGLARLTSLSALRWLARRGPKGDPTETLADRLGAAGIQLAHTGSARGFLFPVGGLPPDAANRLSAAGFRRVRCFRFRQGWLTEA